MPRRGEFGVSRVLVAISHEMKEIDENVVLDGDYGDEIDSSALMGNRNRRTLGFERFLVGL
jgi:hypothetical protein